MPAKDSKAKIPRAGPWDTLRGTLAKCPPASEDALASAKPVSMLTRLQGSMPSRGAAAAEAATAPTSRLPPALWAENLRVPATPPSAAEKQRLLRGAVQRCLELGLPAHEPLHRDSGISSGLADGAIRDSSMKALNRHPTSRPSHLYRQ